jgi:hypothetical protein
MVQRSGRNRPNQLFLATPALYPQPCYGSERESLGLLGMSMVSVFTGRSWSGNASLCAGFVGCVAGKLGVREYVAGREKSSPTVFSLGKHLLSTSSFPSPCLCLQPALTCSVILAQH